MPVNKPTPYDTVSTLIPPANLPQWVFDSDEKIRVASYDLYEAIWRNVPGTFELVSRGTNDSPIYIPSARKCIEATNRYYGVGFDWSLMGGTSADREAIQTALTTLFRREKFRAKFNSIKRFSLIRGDALWHIVADDTKPIGRRISLHELHPSKYHPIYNPDDLDEITGVHIVEEFTDPADISKPLVRRQTYRKVANANGPNTITSELAIFESDGWDDRQLLLNVDYVMKPYQSIKSVFSLPPQITAIPVYHIQNGYEGGHPFGISDLSGFEIIIAALSQSVSDEDLTLALDGLGVYWSTAAGPSGGWALGPGSVIEGADGEDFKRVSGVANVTPFQDHLKYLGGELKEGMAIADIAIGNVNVSVAQSGIALALQMSPILSRNKEKEDELLAVHDHFLFDLINGWLPAYEGLTVAPNSVSVEPRFESPMPVDRDATIKEILSLLESVPPMISVQYAREIIAEKLGYKFPDQMDSDIVATLQNVASAQVFDPFDARIREELAASLGAEGIPTPGA